MSDRIGQSLSALMDDEAGEFELRKTLSELDDKGAATWSRYHLARAAMKKELPPRPELDISDAVMSAIEQEPSYSQSSVSVSKPSNSKFNWRPLGSVAVAASVTMMVMFGAQQFQGGDPAEAVQSQPQLVLSAPKPVNPNLLQAQYGERAVVAPSLQQADVIRLSSSMQYYIDQHQTLVQDSAPQWQVGWLPRGFQEIDQDHLGDAEVHLYSDGRVSVSVSVQPYSSKRASPGAMQTGETVAVGKRVDDRFVTVVGDVPFMIADRIASSVELGSN